MTHLTDEQLDHLSQVLQASGESITGPLSATDIAGGRSNVTLKLSDGAHGWILRMPPAHGRTTSAHDVAREFRVTSALLGTDVPVARAVVLCEYETVLGVPFAVWAFAPGRCLRTSAHLEELPRRWVDAAVVETVQVLATLHRVDPVAIGLANFGRPGGYVQRQLHRWATQWAALGNTTLDRQARGILSWLEEKAPEHAVTSLVHGDYRIDNLLVGGVHELPRVTAVLDWELSTLGDPVADVAMMCAYHHPAFDLIAGEPSAWASALVPASEDLAAAYESASCAQLDNWEFHLVMANFKIAVIAAGIDHRHRSGSGSGPGFNSAGRAVAPFLDAAAQLIWTT